MERLRPVKKLGNGYFIPLWVADMKDLKLEEGMEVDISDLNIKSTAQRGKDAIKRLRRRNA